MNPHAYVLITSDLGTVKAVIKEAKQLPEVKEAYPIYGVYDIILKVETGTWKELVDLIQNKIRGIQNVRSTMTMNIIDNEHNFNRSLNPKGGI